MVVNLPPAQPDGRYVVHWYNSDGTKVRFDGEYQGMISGTSLTVEMDDPAAPPVTRYSVRSEGHATYTSCIADVPEPGETIDLFQQNVVTDPPPPTLPKTMRAGTSFTPTTKGRACTSTADTLATGWSRFR